MTCPDCEIGLVCAIDDDCVSGICGPKLCVATACENFKKDGDETNIDCGGNDCPACVGPIINEVDYDQSPDEAEFVEFVDGVGDRFVVALGHRVRAFAEGGVVGEVVGEAGQRGGLGAVRDEDADRDRLGCG